MARFVEGLPKKRVAPRSSSLYSNVERLAVKLITEKRKIYKGVSANVDFYSGFIYSMLDLPMEALYPHLRHFPNRRMERPPHRGAGRRRQIIRPAYMAVQPHRSLEE